MRHLAGHQERQGVLHARVVGELLEVFVDDLRAGFGRDIVAQIDGGIAVRVDERPGPVVACGILNVGPAAAEHEKQRVDGDLVDDVVRARPYWRPPASSRTADSRSSGRR